MLGAVILSAGQCRVPLRRYAEFRAMLSSALCWVPPFYAECRSVLSAVMLSAVMLSAAALKLQYRFYC